MTIGGEAIQHLRHQLRLLRRAVALLLCIAVVIAALGVAAIRRDADALLHQDDWSELFLWGAVLVAGGAGGDLLSHGRFPLLGGVAQWFARSLSLVRCPCSGRQGGTVTISSISMAFIRARSVIHLG